MDAEILRDLKHFDKRLQTATQLLESCIELFDEQYSEKVNRKQTFSWPYSIQERRPPNWPEYDFKDTPHLSPSTTAICGWAVSRLSGPGSEAQKRLRSVAKKLASLPPTRLKSKTFGGDDDIFLHAQVLRFLGSQKNGGRLFKYVRERVWNIISNPDQTLHPFYLYYCVLALEEVRLTMGITASGGYGDKFRERLRTEVVSQISYAASSDESQFDIGALAYSLAAALRVDVLKRESASVEKALSLIAEYQRGGRWSNVQPNSRTAVGFVHFPPNIEIANAWLSILLLDVNAESQASWGQLDMIMDWLQDTVNKVGKYQGWCNEHDYARDRIDLWVTAQVAQFLLDYRNIRRKLVVRSTSERAGLVMVPPSSLGSWDKLAPTDLGLPKKRRIKNMIEETFVVPFETEGKLRSSSLLLYGPPGTSKTSLMKALANKLGWEFVQITPADFLSAGEDQVEARATLLFEILKRSKDLVVLFDEVDEFLIDRELKDRPGGIFRFMTTSMLPKLQSLKSQGNLIFGIGTNYQERLDKAITRLGRVDYAWPVFPPDFKSRIALIKKFDTGIGETKALSLAADTPLFSYLELERVVSDKSGISDPWKIVTHPTASLKAYANRPEAEDEFKDLLKTQITQSIIKLASTGTKEQLKNQLEALEVKVDQEEHPQFNDQTLRKIHTLINQLG